MRITGGLYRSRKLESPLSDAVRPTSDKVRAALFNMLNSRGVVQDATVLDAFCGTGALGLEALSQGAKHAVFFDKSKKSINICKQNIQNLDVADQTTVFLKDTTKLKEMPNDIQKVGLVFLDPPYRKGFCERTLKALQEGDWLKEDAFIVVEMATDESLNYADLSIQQEKTYGDTKIILGIL